LNGPDDDATLAGIGGETINFFEKREYHCVTGIKLKILSVFPGKKFKDTCISEIELQIPREVYEESRKSEIEKAKAACK